MSRQGALWLVAALLGLVFTAAITWATAQLTSQHIGLSSESLSAAGGLAPPAAQRAVAKRPPVARPKRAKRIPEHTSTKHTQTGTSQSSATSSTSGAGSSRGVYSTAPAPSERGESARSVPTNTTRRVPRTTSAGSVRAPRRQGSSDDGAGDGRESESRSREAGGTSEGAEPGTGERSGGSERSRDD